MLKKYSLSIISVFVLTIVSFGFADTAKAAALDVFLTCPSSNTPLNTEFCPTTPSPGQRWIGTTSGGSCKTLAQVQSIIDSCLPAKNEVYSCTSNSCVCNTPTYPIDCRTSVPAGNKCLATAISSPTAACNTLHKNSDQCGNCTSCQTGYELCGSVCQQIVEGLSCGECPEWQFKKEGDDFCTDLPMVEERVTALEELDLCHFNDLGEYVNDENLPCPESYDPSSLEGQLSALQEAVSFINEILRQLFGLDDIADLIQQLIEGDISDIDGIIAELDTLVGALEPFEGGVAKWDGLTTVNNYKGNQGGYAGADAKCASQYTGSRVCTVEEILYLTRAGTIASSGQAWINGGTPGYTVKANDCDGWKDATATAFGRWWDFTNKAGWLDQCNYAAGHAFACCH
jgi:hypothetical protein